MSAVRFALVAAVSAAVLVLTAACVPEPTNRPSPSEGIVVATPTPRPTPAGPTPTPSFVRPTGPAGRPVAGPMQHVTRRREPRLRGLRACVMSPVRGL